MKYKGREGEGGREEEKEREREVGKGGGKLGREGGRDPRSVDSLM